MPFFEAFPHEIAGKPAICYFDLTILKFDELKWTQRTARMSLSGYHAKLASTFEAFGDVDYVIAFVWIDGEDRMMDLWIQRQLDTYGESAPLTDIIVLRNRRPDNGTIGIACGDTRIVSGREEEHRRLIMNTQGGTLLDYLNGPRPEMPEGMIIPWPK